VVTGLADDAGPLQAKTWTWGGTDVDGVLVYRHLVDQTPTGSPGGAYGGATTTSKAAADGIWYLHVQARDRAGNASAIVTVSVLLDNTAPGVTGLADDDLPTKGKTWTWGGVKEVVTFRYLIDTAPAGVPTGAYGAVTTATQPGGNGLYYLHVQAKDVAGNEGAVTTVRALLDNTSPAVTGLADDAGPLQAKTWTWGGTDADGVLVYRYLVDQTPTGSPGGAYSGTTTASKAATDGVWYLHVQARDRAGNESAVVTVSVLLDNTAPGVTGLADDDLPAKSKTWTWGGAKEAITFRYLIDTIPGGVPTGAYGAVTTATQFGGDGPYYLHVQARDDLGNQGAVVTVRALLDNTAPAPPDVSGVTPSHTATPTWTWTGAGGGNGMYRCSLDDLGGLPGEAETTAGAFVPQRPLSEGSHVLYVQERDVAGNWSTVGHFAMVIDAECTVTFRAGAHGALSGNLSQVLPYGGSSTAVEAVPDYLYVFAGSWSNGVTANPLSLTNVREDMIVTAPFRMADAVAPSGTFLAVVDAAAVAAGRGLWDLGGTYSTIIAGNPLVLSLVHDPTGRITGTATYTVAKATVLTMPVKGRVNGSTGSVTLAGTLKGASPAQAVSMTLSLNLAVDVADRQLTGWMVGSVKTGQVTTAIDNPLALALPASMDGSWTLALKLDRAGRATAGSALLTLSNGVSHTFVTQGRISGANAVLDLRADPADPAAKGIRIRTTITPLGGGWARIDGLSGRGYGQTVGW
jgi:hypothetical protein